MSHYPYETRLDTIVTHAWELWTKNGLGLDSDDRAATLRSVQDAANNTYIKGIRDLDWLNATLKRLRARVKPMTDRKIRIGTRVEGGEGEDHDTGRVIGYIDPPQGECDVMVAWDSGVRTPAVSADVRVVEA